MNAFLFLCAVLVLAYIYGWYHGVKWCKNTIERECNVTIEAPFVITPKEPPCPPPAKP